MIVADTNLIAYAVVKGAHTGAALRARVLDDDWKVPSWWRCELLNVLVLAVRQGVIDSDEAFRAWANALMMMRDTEVNPTEEQVLRSALQHGVSAYDAWFVALADELDVPLVTADRRLAAARPDRAILLEDFVR